MNLKNEEAWLKAVAINKDFYGKACVDVAREVMNELDKGEDFDCHGIISKASKKAKTGGITGFMAGCVAQMVSACHERGEEFRKEWNVKHNAEDSKGVVNPAILTVGK